MHIIMMQLFLLPTAYNVSIISDPLGISIPGTNNAFEYFVGTEVSLRCLVTPYPLSDGEFSWNCSTGCFADMEMEQVINVTELNETDSGILNCSVIINGVQYFSKSFELQVINGKKFSNSFNNHSSWYIHTYIHMDICTYVCS